MAGSIPAASGRIFISYRREETAYPAGWLYDRLAEHYGSSQIFKDVDSIELGDDFVEVITRAVGSCDVLLALIGTEWLTITDAQGRRRLDNPDDFVRLEVQAALARRVRVIPILVEGARMPRADELPDSLASLVRRQALELSPARFDFDTGRLLKVLDRTLAEVRTAQEETASTTAPAGKAPEPSTTQPPKAPEGPQRAEPAVTPSRSPATPATTPVAQPPGDQSRPLDSSTPPLAGVEHRAAAPARVDRLLLVAGQAAIVGAALLVVGLFPAYEWTDSLWMGRIDRIDMRWYALYALIVAILALGAGACTLIPRTRRLIGPGLLLGVVAASTWGLLYLITDRMLYKGILGDGWWLELVAHLALVLAACVAGLALARTGEVRLVRRAPQGELAWLVALLGAASALALIFHDQNLWHINWPPSHWLVVSSIWATVMALVVPVCAAVAVPRQFGVALLAGWIGGGAALFRFHYVWTRYQYGGQTGSNPIITFGFMLLALLIVAVLFARTAPRSQVERTTLR
jgi:TIR domain